MPTTGLKFIFVLIWFLAPCKHNSVFSEQNKNSFYVPLPPNDIRYNSTRKFYKNKRNLYLKKWVVYAKPSLGGIDQVIEYLGSYTHRIAISNYRILELGSTHLRFSYLDRKRGTVGIERIRGEEFIL